MNKFLIAGQGRECGRSRTAEGGFVLITCVLVMLVMALLAISMFRSMGVQERIAGVTRDKQVALNAAITAESYAEWWLLQPQALASAAVSCTNSTSVTVSSFSSPLICNTLSPLSNPASLPWGSTSNTGNIVTPPNFTVSTSGGQNTIYYAPGFYIQLLGTSSSGTVYQIDAYGYGGSAGAAAVVQATYVVTSSGCDASGVRRKVLGATC